MNTTSTRPNHLQRTALVNIYNLGTSGPNRYHTAGPATLRAIEANGWAVRANGAWHLTEDGCRAIRVPMRRMFGCTYSA